jgi:ariadne-1
MYKKNIFIGVCGQKYSLSYSHSCNRFNSTDVEPTSTQKSTARLSLQRYMHHHTRYTNHQESAKLDKTLHENLLRKLNGSIRLESDDSLLSRSESVMGYLDLKYLSETSESLLKARQTLQYSYALAYFLAPDTNATLLFEQNQQDLEEAVEALSRSLEELMESGRDFSVDVKKEVLDRARYISDRRAVLLGTTASDLQERVLILLD